jgi:hypothetical protein
MKGRLVLAALAVVLVAACTWALTRSSATVSIMRAQSALLSIDTSQPGNEFTFGAIGLSTETRELSTDHLSAAHGRLVRLMRLLGPSVLRIGGGTVDLSWWTSSGEPPPPWATSTITPADLDALHGLLSATGWRVILGVDLGHFEPARAANEARWAREILGTGLLGVEIGNEPNYYGTQQDNLRSPAYGVAEYLREAEAYRQALSVAAPGVAIYGPALGEIRWLPQIGAAARMFTEITQHFYPIGTCPDTSSATVAAELLSPEVRQREDEVLQTLATAGSLAGRPTRIGETNSDSCNSRVARPTFASALWSLDWALRAASSGVQGLNFHERLHSCSYLESPVCASGDEAAANAGDVSARPEFYGLLAARQLEGGRFVPTQLSASSSLPDLTTWATLAPNGTIRVAIDNFATVGQVQPLLISVNGYTATVETLTGSSVDASGGIAFGDDETTPAGRWRPRPRRLAHTLHGVRIAVQPASAVIVTLHPTQAGH